ncbi:MAG TPA: EAL domain-containing protein, partial [Thiolinea sp.]|nr:EAL domain-containing protein [Thiolinea sp.]
SGVPLVSGYQEKIYYLSHTTMASKEYLGELHIQVNEKQLKDAILRRAIIISFSHFIKIIFLALLIVVFINQTITRHLIDIVNYLLEKNIFQPEADNLTAVHPPPQTAIKNNQLILNRTYCNDELQFLADIINKTRAQNIEYSSSIHKKEKELQVEFNKRKDAEQAVYQQYKLTATMITLIDVSIFALNRQTEIVMINDEAANMLNIRHTDAIGIKLQELILFDKLSDNTTTLFEHTTLPEGQPVIKSANCKVRGSSQWFPAKITMAPFMLENGELGMGLMINDLSAARKLSEANYIATHDFLTGLYNRFAMEKKLTGILKNDHDNHRHSHCIALIDLDNFKDINDNYGHRVGDEAIKYVASCMSRHIGPHDYAVRQGGDEFTILFQNSLSRARESCQAILNEIQMSHLDSLDQELMMTASIGLTQINGEQDNITSLFNRLDSACYQIKSIGGAGISIADTDLDIKVELESRHQHFQKIRMIKSALNSNRLVLYQQKIIALKPGLSDRVEILFRLFDHNRLIMPDEVMDTISKFNYTSKLDQAIIENTELLLRKRLIDSQTLNINLCLQSLNNPSLVKAVFSLLETAARYRYHICFEITENSIIQNKEKVKKFINKARHHGASFAIDDFGSTNSSYGITADLPIDQIKIDGRLVEDFRENDAHRAIVMSIIQLARSLEVQVIVEWVNSFQDLEELRELAIDYCQSFLLAQPAPIVQPVTASPELPFSTARS